MDALALRPRHPARSAACVLGARRAPRLRAARSNVALQPRAPSSRPALLTARVIADGPLLALRRAVLRRPVQRVPGRADRVRRASPPRSSRGPYMRIEQEHGKLTPARLRLYHSMYQLFSFTMLLALLTNNMGILWVAMEAATLDHRAAGEPLPHAGEPRGGVEVLHPVRRRHRAGAVRHDPALLRRREGARRRRRRAAVDASRTRCKAQLEPTVLSLAFVFLLVGYGTKVGLVPLHNWLPDAHAEGPTPVSAVLSGLLLNVALYARRALQGAGRRRARHARSPAT